MLQGLPASGTMNAVMAYMLADWYRPGVVLDFPKGGSSSIVDALVRGVRKNGSKVCLNASVEEILVENDKVIGVKLADGKIIKVRQAVVSNADPYITNKLLSKARN
ncbi:MAG: phytoene dehydrogenase-like protein, partial [Bacillariaceae sp.]